MWNRWDNGNVHKQCHWIGTVSSIEMLAACVPTSHVFECLLPYTHQHRMHTLKKKMKISFCSKYKHLGTTFCIVFFWSPVCLSACLSLSSHLLCRDVHTQHLALSLLELDFRSFHSFFSVLHWVSSLVVFIGKKRKVILGWVFSLRPTFPSVEGLLIFPEAISAASMPGSISSLIFSKPW